MPKHFARAPPRPAHLNGLRDVYDNLAAVRLGIGERFQLAVTLLALGVGAAIAVFSLVDRC